MGYTGPRDGDSQPFGGCGCCSKSVGQIVCDGKIWTTELSREVGLAWFRGSRAVKVRTKGGGAWGEIWEDEGERGWATVEAGACCIRYSVAEAAGKRA